MIRLNLACGEIIIPGWINVDLYDSHADVKSDVSKLTFEDNYADEIWASHIIEHFHFFEAFDVLKEWLRVLKPGGKIMIETPDMLASCKKFVNGSEQDRVNLYGHFFAQPWVGPGQVHKMLYTENQLRWTLEQCGYVKIKKVPALRYIGGEDQNLGMEAYKADEVKSKVLQVTQMLTFEIGTDCNLSKLHTKCPINYMDRAGKTLTDEIIISSVVDAYTNLGFTGFVTWSFYNEPMLHIERILSLMERIRVLVPQSRFFLWTNGTILKEDIRMKLFERIWVTNYLSTPNLEKSFPNMVVNPSIQLDDRLDKLGESNKKRCLLPLDNLLISNTGEVYICCLDYKNEVKIGNIFDLSLKEIDEKRWEYIQKVSGKEMYDAHKSCICCKYKWDISHFDEGIRSKALQVIEGVTK